MMVSAWLHHRESFAAQCRTIGVRLSTVGVLATVCLLLSAHVGTNQVIMEGRAGGYPVRVLINPPGVVPAQVPIAVRVLEGTPTRVSLRAAQWNLGTKGAPPAEDAAPVPGDAGVWSLDLWIMTASVYAVYITVEGPAGNGTLVVPMQTSATRTLGMERGMGVVLAALGTLLVAGMLTIIGAAVREGPLSPGERPTPARTRAARIAMASGAAVLALALFGGSTWWNAEEREYKRRMFKPIAMTSNIRLIDEDRLLTVAITDSLWRMNRFSPLMPDHGKLMHLFLVRADEGTSATAIAHLHPLRIHADTFVTRVPDVPAGRYYLFADILFQSGGQRTLVDTVTVPVSPVVAGEADSRVATSSVLVPALVPALTGDDAWRALSPQALGSAYPLSGGATLTLRVDGPVRIGRDLRLAVSVREADGSSTMLEPYMGMAGHAMVMRRDAAVFMHLHPMGSASMAAQAQLIRRERGDTAMLDSSKIAAVMAATEDGAAPEHAAHTAMAPTTATTVQAPVPLAFPFAFPNSGAYRVFVQVRRQGVIETAAFDVTVPQ